MALIDEIKQEYPHPIVCPKDKATPGYCVGGAVCLFVTKLPYSDQESLRAFPRDARVAIALRDLNPQLPPGKAFFHAVQITENNDKGNFDEAWHNAQLALEYRKEVPS